MAKHQTLTTDGSSTGPKFFSKATICKLFPHRFKHEHGISNKPEKSLITEHVSRSYHSSDHLMKTMAIEASFKNPAEIFLKGEGERAKFLHNFCSKALENGFQPEQIAEAIIKWGYAADIIIHKDVDSTGGQAPQLLQVSLAQTDIARALRNERTITIEGNVDANCTFGSKLEHSNMSEVIANVLYIIDDTANNGRPQASGVMIRGTCKGESDFDQVKDQVLHARKEFERKMGVLVQEGHWLKKHIRKNKETIKFRIYCTVLNDTDGKLYVVSETGDSKPIVFSEWVKLNKNDILSSSDEQLDKIDKYVRQPNGLLDKLRTGSTSDEWTNLKKDIMNNGGIIDPISRDNSTYRQAIKIWRFALLTLQAEAFDSLANRHKDLSAIEKILGTWVKLACDDGRQYGNIKVLGAILSRSDFASTFLKNNLDMKTLRFVAHYGCGFLTNAHKIFKAFEVLENEIKAERDKRERDSMTGFFTANLSKILTGGAGPRGDNPIVCEEGALRDRLPAKFKFIHDALDEYHGQPVEQLISGVSSKYDVHVTKEEVETVSLINELFAGGNKKLRGVVFTAIRARVFERRPGKLISMGAAELVYSDLKKYKIEDKLSFTQKNALVSEEVARRAFENYVEWKNVFNRYPKIVRRTFGIEYYMENFKNGQMTIVPERPRNKEAYLDFKREDYYLKNYFTRDEIKDLGFEGMLVYNLAA